MAYCWLNHINRFDHFMKIFKIWLPGKLPPTHTHTVKQQLVLYSQFSNQTHRRESATVLQGQRASPPGPMSTPCRDSADPGTLPPGVLSLHTVRKQKPRPEENRDAKWNTMQASEQGTNKTQTMIGRLMITAFDSLRWGDSIIILLGFFKFSFIFCFQSVHNYGLTINLQHRGNVPFTKVVYSKPLGFGYFGNLG